MSPTGRILLQQALTPLGPRVSYAKNVVVVSVGPYSFPLSPASVKGEDKGVHADCGEQCSKKPKSLNEREESKDL